MTLTVSIENEITNINKNGEEVTKNRSFMLQFIDGARFMASPIYGKLHINYTAVFLSAQTVNMI